ncbi:MAG: bifunctional 4-hydroxy-3-methylbut-2-enyl diphosphate reductase/30S ribosomal protein S1 [Oscillospiraceae bacterium]|nr:bifunctional 4-hydroxy-3-methylbut-2-enyl diphosphate reductase/30S ribosomal protein S1 [Oscillospiraceae bacterium]
MIKVAKTAGFCYGVKRAVDSVYDETEKKKKLATLGHLIHNRQVIEDLEEKGVKSYTKVEEIPRDMTVVIRAHGVGENVYKELQGRDYIDLTCPFVSKIHKIVSEHHKKGYQIVIVGDRNHPEVIGINGWCGNEALIINALDYEFDDKLREKDLCVVAQTTINREFFVEIVQNIKKTCKSTLIFDTICSATKDRQKEADELSRNSDMMIVIGGMESSNTRKLFEISKRNCPVTYHIETFEDLPQKKTYNKIGITAGASTPGSIIEEVVKAMSENVKNEENFAELFEQYESKTLNNGDIIDGTVVEVRANEVIVDLGGFKYNGQLAADQLTDDPSLKPSDVVKEGDTIKVYVVGVNDGEGKVVLSRKKLVAMESWNKIKAAYEEEKILEGKIIKAVKGGVIALTDGSQVFIPARQASGRFVQDLQSLVGTTVTYKIIEIDDRRKRVIGSVRVLIEAERKAREEKFWADAEVGKRYQGTVKSLTSFGAFVDIGGVDGLVHISELSWNKIKHPSEVVKEGDVLDVYIKDINAETKKISLGYKKTEDNPWVIAQSKINLGDVIKCKIVRMMPFGAFAEIMPNVDGLIHISQIADRRITKPEDVLTIGEEVEAKVTDLNWEDKKISLSIRALIPVPEKVEEVEEEIPAEPMKEEALVYSTDPEVEVEEVIEIEPAEEEAAEAPAAETPAEEAAEAADAEEVAETETPAEAE